MHCPVDNSTLTITERQGVEIDYCPQCRGVWLDRGELDKIIDRSNTLVERGQFYAEEGRHSDYTESKTPNHHKPRKKESFLSDLFDFGD